jgi:hypothetical protein
MASRNADDSFGADEMALNWKAKMLILWSYAGQSGARFNELHCYGRA